MRTQNGKISYTTLLIAWNSQSDLQYMATMSISIAGMVASTYLIPRDLPSAIYAGRCIKSLYLSRPPNVHSF